MKPSFNRMASGVVLSLVTEFFVLVSFFLLFRLVSDRFGVDGLGVFALSKRAIALLIPIIMLGMYDYLSRYLPMKTRDKDRFSMILIGIGVQMLTSGICLLLLVSYPATSAELLLGDEQYADLMFPFGLLLIALSFQSLVLAVLRGFFKIVSFNILQLLSHAVLPILIVMFYPGDFRAFLVALALAYLLTPFVFLAALFIRQYAGVQPGMLTLVFMENTRYGIPRIPNRIIEGAFFAIPPLFAVSVVSIEQAGHLALALSLMLGMASIISPLSIVLLPHLSAMVAEGRSDEIGQKLHFLTGGLIQVLLFPVTQFLVHDDLILVFWMGDSYHSASQIMSIIFFSVLFYGFYIGVKPALDAARIEARNTRNTVISLLVLLLTLFLSRMLGSTEAISTAIALSFAFSMFILAWLTHRDLEATYPDKKGQDWRSVQIAVVLCLPLALLAMALKPYVGHNVYLFFTMELVIGILYLLGLVLLRSASMLFILESLWPGFRRATSWKVFRKA